MEGQRKDWDGFFKACVDDLPNRDVIDAVGLLADSRSLSMSVHIFSGRNEVVRAETVEWLDTHLTFEYSLTMRPNHDRRPDNVLKRALVREGGLSPSNVLCVFDDRKAVVDMWRKEGFTCFQVADHDF